MELAKMYEVLAGRTHTAMQYRAPYDKVRQVLVAVKHEPPVKIPVLVEQYRLERIVEKEQIDPRRIVWIG